MALWFRFYSDAMRHPKVAKLSDAEFRLWVELLSVASDNDGRIPPLTDLKHVLKRRLDHLSRGVEGLLRASLIDPLGDGYEPHDWSKRQYKSDTSTERVKKFREKRNVSVTPPESETESETESDRDFLIGGDKIGELVRKSASRLSAERGHMSDSTVALLRRDCPGWDLNVLHDTFSTWVNGDPSRHPDNWQKAFIGWVRRHHKKNRHMLPA